MATPLALALALAPPTATSLPMARLCPWNECATTLSASMPSQRLSSSFSSSSSSAPSRLSQQQRWQQQNERAPLATLRVRVQNTGTMTGASPVLAFVSPPGANDATDADSSGLPVRTLVGFDKVHLEPGQVATVAIDVRCACRAPNT